MHNKTLRFSLKIPSSKMLQFYEGHAKNLVVTLNNGQTVQLPLINFRPFVTDLGLYGEFEVVFTQEFKLVSLHKLKQV